MDELVARLVAKLGIDREVAAKAIGIILAFLIKEGPTENVGALLDRMPGTREAAQASAGNTSLFAMGGIMGVGTQLLGAGLSLGQVQDVTKILLTQAREKLGNESVGAIISTIPGLSQFA